MTAKEIVARFKDCHCIRISGKRYAPSLFMNMGGTIYSYNKHFGLFERKEFSLEKLEEHIQKMLDEGLKVEFI